MARVVARAASAAEAPAHVEEPHARPVGEEPGDIDDGGGVARHGGLSVAAAAHVAVARANVIRRVDLDGPQLGAFNPVAGGAIFDGPRIELTDAPGLGILAVRGLDWMGA